jgi:hypothetical protein
MEKVNIPKKVVRDSQASRNSVVATALSFSALMGTSTKDLLKVSRSVDPGGMVGAMMKRVFEVGSGDYG